MLEYLDKLEDIEKGCNLPNWDGYGAKPIHPSIVTRTKEFLSKLSEELSSYSVFPDIDGTILIEWGIDPTKTLEITIGDKPECACCSINDNDYMTELFIFKKEIPPYIIGKIKDYC